MAKIGIFGGTFNPIHKGHVSLVKQARNACNLDCVWIIPSNQPPHKTVTSLAPNEMRKEMCQIAFKDEKIFPVSDIEFQIGGQSYTIQTLRMLKEKYPNDTFYLILGSDMIYSFDLWKDYKQILKLAVVVAGAREKAQRETMQEKAEKLCQSGGDVRIIPIEAKPMSSTKIRMMLSQGLDVSSYLDPDVFLYIKKNGLYRYSGMKNILSEIQPIIKQRLTKARYLHTICVANQAKKLAEHYHMDADIASLCGYLHDIMKNRPKEEMLRYLQDNGILLSKTERNIPAVWHAIAGALYCKLELGIQDAQIINAIRYHTTGRKNMTRLEKVLFVADATGEDRDYEETEQIRKESFRSLDAAVLSCLEQNFRFLLEIERPIHPDSIKAYNDLVIQKRRKENERRPF